MPCSSDDLGPIIAAAIGLPTTNLVSFTLRFQAHQPIRCDAEYLIPESSGTGITQLIGKRYEVSCRAES